MPAAVANSGTERLSQLRWLCRRGMKELDLLLESFLAREATALEQGSWPDLEALLQFEDIQLWDWLLHADTPPGQPFVNILAALRATGPANGPAQPNSLS